MNYLKNLWTHKGAALLLALGSQLGAAQALSDNGAQPTVFAQADETLVAPAPEGLLAPAPEGLDLGQPGDFQTAPATPQSDPSQATNLRLAEEFGLHIVQGRPVLLGTERSVLSESQLAGAAHFIDFLKLGLDPDLFNRQTGCFATSYLPPSVFSEYLVTGTEVGQSPGEINNGPEISKWKGANEFERERAREALIAEHGSTLRAKAVSTPLEALFIARIQLGPYDRERGGFDLPFNERTFSANGLTSFSTLVTYLGMRNKTKNCSGLDLKFNPPAVKLPEYWQIDATEAEAIVQRLGNERQLFFAMTVKLTAEPRTKMLLPYPTGDHGDPAAIDILSVQLFEDADLERPIATLPIVRAEPPVLLAGAPAQLPSLETAPLDEETLALLTLKAQGDVLSDKAWQQLMIAQANADSHYYQRKSFRDSGSSTYSSTSETYDPLYVPFFHAGYQPKNNAQFTAEQIALFKEWAMLKANALPEDFVFRARLTRQGASKTSIQLPIMTEKDRSGLLPVVQAEGYSIFQALLPHVNAMKSGYSRYNPVLFEGPNGKRTAAIILPEVATTYIPTADTPGFSAASEGSFGTRLVELTLTHRATKLVPMAEGEEGLLLNMTPKTMVIWDNKFEQALFQTTYASASGAGNAVATPGESLPQDAGLDAQAPLVPTDLSITPPATDKIEATAEIIDLLIMKLAPASVTDDTLLQMMRARWAYEASLPPTKGEPVWGRFFEPGRPKPSEADELARLNQFKSWTAKRAAALPSVLQLRYSGANFNQLRPMSVQASPRTGVAASAEQLKRLSRSCRSSASQYSVLTPACEYLETINETSPSNLPYGFGTTNRGVGPRFSCATIDGAADVYCKERVAQYPKDTASQPAPDFRDLMILDKEVYYPEDAPDVAALRSKAALLLEINVNSITVQDSPLVPPVKRAQERYAAFCKAVSIQQCARFTEREVPKGTFYVLDATVLDAKLVERYTAVPMQQLELKPTRVPALDSLVIPEGLNELPDTPFGPEILGVKLGMTFAEAEKIIRSKMTVGQVLVKDRSRLPTAATGGFEKFSSARAFVSQDGQELFVLFDEPPLEGNRVVAMAWQRGFPAGQLSPASALAQMRSTYGQENWTARDGTVAWGEQLAQLPADASSTRNCVAGINQRGQRDWLTEAGQPLGRDSAVKTLPHLSTYQPYGIECGPVLSMSFTPSNRPNTADKLSLAAMDAVVYWTLFRNNREAIKAGEATFGEAPAGPDIFGNRDGDAPALPENSEPPSSEDLAADTASQRLSDNPPAPERNDATGGGGSAIWMIFVLVIGGLAAALIFIPGLRQQIQGLLGQRN